MAALACDLERVDLPRRAGVARSPADTRSRGRVASSMSRCELGACDRRCSSWPRSRPVPCREPARGHRLSCSAVMALLWALASCSRHAANGARESLQAGVPLGPPERRVDEAVRRLVPPDTFEVPCCASRASTLRSGSPDTRSLRPYRRRAPARARRTRAAIFFRFTVATMMGRLSPIDLRAAQALAGAGPLAVDVVPAMQK